MGDWSLAMFKRSEDAWLGCMWTVECACYDSDAFQRRDCVKQEQGCARYFVESRGPGYIVLRGPY
jgi:hypothetical protein